VPVMLISSNAVSGRAGWVSCVVAPWRDGAWADWSLVAVRVPLAFAFRVDDRASGPGSTFAARESDSDHERGGR
jgi:hypothetical protein